MSRSALWIVWNPAGRNPQARHDTYRSAAAEAARLARENPGNEFYVMQAHRVVCLVSPLKVEDFDTEIDIPF